VPLQAILARFWRAITRHQVRLRALLLCVAMALSTAACGGGGDAESVLSDTASRLGEVRSGELSVSLIAEGGGTRAGFDLTGPFALPEDGRLPVAKLAYTQIAGQRQATVTLISTGEKAFVEANGSTYVLPQKQTERLRGVGASVGSGGSSGRGLGSIGLDEWLVDPQVSEGEQVGDAETERISAELDVVQAANDLLALLAAFQGGQAPLIQGRDAETLRAATEEATVEILTGTEDRLLRSLVVDLRLSADAPQGLREQLGPLGRAHFRLELGITNPNESVTVEAPPNAEPFPAGAGL
jgi:hypothetical protein